MKSVMADSSETERSLRWQDLDRETGESLSGKLTGLWGAASDEEAFDSLALDKQQALLLISRRLRDKDLWKTVRRVDNVYGIGGVGLDFTPWPFLKATLSRRRDFTRAFAKRRQTAGGFYEKGPTEAVLHFLYHEGKPRQWHVHFDLYSPVQSVGSALKHLRHEYWGRMKPDWRMIASILQS
jgi:hypothetical protein